MTALDYRKSDRYKDLMWEIRYDGVFIEEYVVSELSQLVSEEINKEYVAWSGGIMSSEIAAGSIFFDYKQVDYKGEVYNARIAVSVEEYNLFWVNKLKEKYKQDAVDC